MQSGLPGLLLPSRNTRNAGITGTAAVVKAIKPFFIEAFDLTGPFLPDKRPIQGLSDHWLSKRTAPTAFRARTGDLGVEKRRCDHPPVIQGLLA